MAIFENASQKQLSQQYEQDLKMLQAQADMEQLKMQAVQAQMMQHSAMLNSSPGTLGGYGQQQSAKQRDIFNPNKREAFQIPLSQLVTMWQAKHGDQWVHADAPILPTDDQFYVDGLRRLLNEELFEHYNGWVRLKENVENILADR